MVPTRTTAETSRIADPKLLPAERPQDRATERAAARAQHKQRIGNTHSQKKLGSAPGIPTKPVAIAA